ncbi:hypothetical protein KBTX_00253 [wastewater metagenome]|uniref:HTH-type transcriptional regulator MurR n=2 Tax=unclassified sequences TaxID=12908 RepID=A0A5B8R9F7_9ZZZZ|nr:MULTISPECIES: MurR/RpiR family transcriptional regulator [Arhodomonas]MCS4504154.1 MurR/RpiR family transcriptional regulator [Arhodomonas aquaeolei]QEA03952.1 hypothetical protein KBTEX_00253 [uncultured organism]
MSETAGDEPTLPLPPRSLDGLRRVVEAGRRREAGVRLGQRSLAILEHMLDNPEEATLGSIAAIARQHGVSASTLTRLARRLGFDGFKAFQHLFRVEVARGRHFYTEQAQRLMETTTEAGRTHSPGMAAAGHELQNLADTAASLDAGTVTAVRDAVLRARRLYVLGLRGCYGVAHYLGYYLGFIGKPVSTLGAAGFTLAEEISDITPDDLLIAATVRPETRLTVDACRMAAGKGVPVVTLTNHYASPVREYGRHNLYARCDGPYYFNPVAGLFMVAEVVLAEVAAALGEAMIDPLGRREASFEALGIE